MEKWKRRAIDLLVGLGFTSRSYPSVVPYSPSKTNFSRFETKDIPRSSPEKQGVSSSRIYSLLEELENEGRANIHNIMILKGDCVISEASRPGYSTNISHLSHSMSKSLTGIAIGFLVEEGRLSLNTKLADLFPDYEMPDKRTRNLTVYHLLTMTTGVPFSEAGSVTEYEWTRAFFESRLLFAPGEMFAYNSMNSYILARIVVKLSGMSLFDFLSVRLFEPLGIKNAFWEIGPEGVEKGGWGVFLSAESWAKIGLMMLNLGYYKGERIISKSWIIDSISTHAHVNSNLGSFDYGYHLWVNRDSDDFLFNGMLGQNVWVCPHNNIVVVINSENNELFQSSPALNIIRKYFGKDMPEDDGSGIMMLQKLRDKEEHFFESRRWAIPSTPQKGILYRLGLRRSTPFIPLWNEALGTYTFAKNNHGILPLFVRAMQNNYSGGIESFTLERDGEGLFFTSREGGHLYRFEVGLYEPKSTVVNFNGEKYILNVVGEAMEDAERNIIYKIEIMLPEMPNSRRIKLSIGASGRIVAKLAETPNHELAAPLIEGLYATNPKLSFAVNILEKRLGDKFITRKLESLFAPTIVGVNTESERYEEILALENARVAESLRVAKGVASLLLKLTDD